MTPDSGWIGRHLPVSELRVGTRFQVPAGGRALLVVAGAAAETLGGGSHDLRSLAADVVARVRSEPAPDVALLNDSTFAAEFTPEMTRSAGGDSVELAVRVTLRLAEPHLAATALLGGRETLTIRDLQSRLAPLANDALRATASRLTTEELIERKGSAALQAQLLDCLAERLAACGLAAVRADVVRIEVADPRQEPDPREEDPASLRSHGAQLEHQQADLDQELARLQGRNRVLDKLLDEGVLERMARLESEQEWLGFRQEIDQRRYLADKEWNAIRADAAAATDEAEIRAHYLFKRIAAMSEFEFASLQESHDASLRLLRAQGDAELLQETYRAERLQLDTELESRQRVFSRELEERQHWFDQLQREQASASDLALLKVERLETMRHRRRESAAGQALEAATALAEIQAQMTPEQILASAVASRPDRGPEIAAAIDAIGSGTGSSESPDVGAATPEAKRSRSATAMDPAISGRAAPCSIGLAVPARVTTTGRGTLLVPVELYDRTEFDPPRWRAACWLADTEPQGANQFDASGVATLAVPGSYYGRLPVRVELHDTLGFDRYGGTFILTLSHEPDGSMVIQPAAHEAHAGAIIYQPMELSLPAPSRRPAAVEGKEHIRVQVLREDRAAMRLSDISEPPRLLHLQGRPGGVERVLTVHQGDTTVVGRCHTWQLDSAAAARLARTGADTIHWITRWDDPAVNRLSARLAYSEPGAGSATLEMENLTDYSDATTEMVIEGDGVEHTVAAGFTRQFALQADVELRLLGRGYEHPLLRFVLREHPVGDTHVPVLMTSRTRFEHPPSGAASHSVRFLGAWLPWPPQRLRALLAKHSQPVSISFLDEACQLELFYEASVDDVVVVSTEDLRQATDRS